MAKLLNFLMLFLVIGCGPIYVVDGGGGIPGYNQPDFANEAMRQGQRNNDLIIRCGGRAVDFVTGRCL